MKRVALGAALLTLLLVPASPAMAQQPPAKVSEGVEFVGFVPQPGIISARFRDGLMYVSAESGLTIYDVGDPAAPRQVARMPLPNFENEDIDLGHVDGRDIALISNDPSEGVGLLHVIDVTNPAQPTRIASFNTGSVDGGSVGAIGTIFGIPSPFGWGTGHTASCVADCKYVYLAGTGSGLDIVDLTNPAQPKYAKNFPADEAKIGKPNPMLGAAGVVHDVQFDGDGNALVVGMGGLAAYDVSDPLNPTLAYQTNDDSHSRYFETLGADDGSTVNDYIHHNSMRLKNSDIAASGGDPAADSDYLAITEEDYNRPTCTGAGSFHTWRLVGDVAELAGRWDVEVDPSRQSLGAAHYFDVRGGLVAQGWYEQGTRFLDVSDPANIRQVGYWIPNKALTWGALFPPTDTTGEIVYSLDNPRGIDVLRFDRPEPGEPPRPTVVAPPGNAPEEGGGGAGGGGAGGGPSGTASAIRPNVALTISDRRQRARRGTRLRYRVTLRHVAGATARDIEVLLVLPRGLKRRGRTRVFRRLAELRPRASRTWLVKARVSRRSKRRTLLAQARVTLADDANPRDNRAVDRTLVVRRAARARMSRAERDHLLAQNMALLPTVRAPKGSGSARQIPQQRTGYGWVCRIAG